ncbi:hypothetical protein GQ457_08G001010 [Hibiscus cannabinus]
MLSSSQKFVSEGTCITRAKYEKIPHEYSTVVGIQESVHEILMNLKEIVLRGNLYGTCNTFVCAKGPGYVTAQDIILPPSVEIVDNTRHIASLTEPIDLCIGLQIERNRGYSIKRSKNFHDGSYPIDVVFINVFGFKVLRTLRLEDMRILLLILKLSKARLMTSRLKEIN